MLILGTAGYLLKQIDINPAPIVLGLILGGIAEIGFVQALLTGMAYKFPIVRLFQNQLSLILIGMVVLSAAWPYFAAFRRRKSRKKLMEKEQQNQ
jgi:putative tricarboxylic transport membrane protein